METKKKVKLKKKNIVTLHAIQLPKFDRKEVTIKITDMSEWLKEEINCSEKDLLIFIKYINFEWFTWQFR